MEGGRQVANFGAGPAKLPRSVSRGRDPPGLAARWGARWEYLAGAALPVWPRSRCGPVGLPLPSEGREAETKSDKVDRVALRSFIPAAVPSQRAVSRCPFSRSGSAGAAARRAGVVRR